MNDLPVIQKTYDLSKWYIPILNRLPREHKFALGDRITAGLYDFLEGLIVARYAQDKLPLLESLNSQLDILRHQTRLMLDFCLIKVERYEYIVGLLNVIGNELGGWIKQQWQLKTQLESKTYQPGAYKTFQIKELKPRMISAAPYRDRVVHHALCNIIMPIFEPTFIRDSYANRVGYCKDVG